MSALLRAPLVPCAVLFGSVAAARRRAYDIGLARRVRLPVPVISVGNLVVGGTGKTPFVRTLCRLLLARGERPLILGRGYGASAPGDTLDEEGRSLRRDLPEVPVVQGADRSRAVAPHLDGPSPPTVIVLDDGGQTLRIARDLDVMLVDARRAFGSGWPLPAGTLREFPGTLRHADLIVVTRADETSAASLDRLCTRLGRLAPGAPVCITRHRPERVWPPDAPPESLAGEPVFLVSAIANPRSFRRTVEELGADVRGARAFPDHFAFGAEDVREVDEEAARVGAHFVLATGKDEPKLAPLATPSFRYLEVSVALDGDAAPVLSHMFDSVLRGSARDVP